MREQQCLFGVYAMELHLVRHLMSSSAAWLEVPITQSVRYSTILFLQTRDDSINESPRSKEKINELQKLLMKKNIKP